MTPKHSASVPKNCSHSIKGMFRKKSLSNFGGLVDLTKKSSFGAKIMFRVNFHSLAINDRFSGAPITTFGGTIFFPKTGWGGRGVVGV